MVDRIKKIMEFKEMTPATFAESIEINRSNLTHLFSGRNQPSLDLARKILKAFPDISTEWLIMGVGNMQNSIIPEKPIIEKKQVDLFEDTPNLFHTEESCVQKTGEKSIPEESFSPVVSSIDEKKIVQPESEIVVPKPKNDSQSSIPIVTHDPTPVEEQTLQSPILNDADNNNAQEPIDVKEVSKRECHPLPENYQKTEKKVTKIVFFYDDNHFDVYYPNN